MIEYYTYSRTSHNWPPWNRVKAGKIFCRLNLLFVETSIQTTCLEVTSLTKLDTDVYLLVQ